MSDQLTSASLNWLLNQEIQRQQAQGQQLAAAAQYQYAATVAAQHVKELQQRVPEYRDQEFMDRDIQDLRDWAAKEGHRFGISPESARGPIGATEVLMARGLRDAERARIRAAQGHAARDQIDAAERGDTLTGRPLSDNARVDLVMEMLGGDE